MNELFVKDFPFIYRVCEVVDVDDPEDMGRAKLKLLDTEQSPDLWIPILDSLYSSETNGWHGVLGKGDIVRVSFIDYPLNQKPIIDGKMKSGKTSEKRDGAEFFLIKGHKVKFEDDKLSLIHKDGTEMIVENDKIVMNATTTFGDIVFGGLGLFDFLSKLKTVGNLGLSSPLDPTQIIQITTAIANSKTITVGK